MVPISQPDMGAITLNMAQFLTDLQLSHPESQVDVIPPSGMPGRHTQH